MSRTVVFEVCRWGRRADKGSCAKVGQQRTRALFNALLMHSRPSWNVLKALREPLGSEKHDSHTQDEHW